MNTEKRNLFVVDNTQKNGTKARVLKTDYNDLCMELARSRTLHDITQRIQKIINSLGFTHFLFLRLERVWQNDSQHGLLHSMPDEFMRVYHEENLYDSDLIIQYGRYNSHPIFSSQIYNYIDGAPFDMKLTQDNRQLLQLQKRFSFFDYCVIPMAALNGSGHVQLLLTTAGADVHELQSIASPKMSTCRALCKAIDSVSTKKFRSSFIDQKDNPVKITKKPLLTLQRLASSDLTITDLAIEMCMSPITAHQHIAAARKALSAKTNIGAIVKAIRYGLINID